MNKSILIFGNGYVSDFLSVELMKYHWFVYCTSRQVELTKQIKTCHYATISFEDPELPIILNSVSHVLSTVPSYSTIIDPVLEKYYAVMSTRRYEWVGYLSSTSVYGNHNGEWVNEQTECMPSNFRSKDRLLAEQKWLELYLKHQLPIHIFRLSGIYGPGRNCLEEIINGKDFTIVKENQYFSRIHVSDICETIIKSIHSPAPGEIYNVCDDEPTPINVVQQFGAKILKNKPLKEVLFEDALLSEQAKNFFHDNKRVSNNKISTKLKVKLRYPNYRVGLLKGCLPYLKLAPVVN